MSPPLGLYISIPFCAAKCSYCNFASGVGSPGWQSEYCGWLEREIELTAERFPGRAADTVYWGGGTPSLLAPELFQRLMERLRAAFDLEGVLEHTVEAAPGSLAMPTLEAWIAQGVNRISFGMQSFQTAELRAVGRRHDAATLHHDLAQLRDVGIDNLNLDLIAGLPHQTAASWAASLDASLDAALATGVPHISVYMLEIDDDSRLGRELLAGGTRYHAASVPDEDAIAEMYELACRRLPAAGLAQYEISNFALRGWESRHNERYWLRQPYLGFGVDAHSFMTDGSFRRWRNPDTLPEWMAELRVGRLPHLDSTVVSDATAREETIFLGLRRSAGIDCPAGCEATVEDLVSQGLVLRHGSQIQLTARGRMFSNEVFVALLTAQIDAQGESMLSASSQEASVATVISVV